MANFDGSSDRRSPIRSSASTPSSVDSPNSVSTNKNSYLPLPNFSATTSSHSSGRNETISSISSAKDNHLLAPPLSTGFVSAQIDIHDGGLPADRPPHLFSRTTATNSIMDVLDIVDNASHISTCLSTLQIEQSNSKTVGFTTSPGTASITNLTEGACIRQANKRSRIASEESTVGDISNKPLRCPQDDVLTEHSPDSWADQMDQVDAIDNIKADRDIRNFLPTNLVPYYSAARSLLEKRVKAFERLEFYQCCQRSGVIPSELIYSPKVPKGVTLSAAEIVSWNTHIHHSEMDILSQLILSMKRQSATVDKEATRALLDFNNGLTDHRVSHSNIEKSKTILSEKVGRERALYKSKLKEQLTKLTDSYKVIQTNMHFLKNAGAVPKNKPLRPVSHQSSPTRKMKKTSVTHPPSGNRALHTATSKTVLHEPHQPNLSLPARSVSRQMPTPSTGTKPLPETQSEGSTQTALLLQVVERLDRQQEELNYLRNYPSLPQNRVRSRSPRQQTRRDLSTPRSPFHPQTWQETGHQDQQSRNGRSHQRGRQSHTSQRGHSQKRRDQSRRPDHRQNRSGQRQDRY